MSFASEIVTIFLTVFIVVDPFGLSGAGFLPPAVETDRSTKLNLIQQLSHSPDIVILGSSRARQSQEARCSRARSQESPSA